jgi:hypothetical protein
MTTLTLSPVGRRALPRERPPHSAFAVASDIVAAPATLVG